MRCHLPDPVISRADGTNPEDEALLADSVGLALLVVLDTLAPAERLAFVLHDVFDLPFDDIAPMVGRSPATARQLASRARRRVRDGAAEVARRALAIASPAAPKHPVLVNGAAGVLITLAGQPVAVMGFTVSAGKITEIDAIADPGRLRRLDLAAVLA